MARMTLTKQSPVPLRQANQIKATGDKDMAKEVVPEEEVTKDMTEEADASFVQHTLHCSETSREKWRILAWF